MKRFHGAAVVTMVLLSAVGCGQATTPAPPSAPATISNAVLLSRLKINGTAFDSINGTPGLRGVATAGVITGNSGSWTVVVDNRNGSFTFGSEIDGSLVGLDLDASAMTSNGSSLAAPVSLGSWPGALPVWVSAHPVRLLNPPKRGSAYKIGVTADNTKASGTAGRYLMSVTLNTAGTSDWGLYTVGGPTTAGYGFDGNSPELHSSGPVTALVAGKTTMQITATVANEAFVVLTTLSSVLQDVTSWAVVIPDNTSAGAVTLARDSALANSGDGMITFAATVGNKYTITVDTNPVSFASTNFPTVKVTSP